MPADEVCDVAIAGGGPSGLQFAIALGKRYDGDIVVYEAHESISDNKKSTGGTFDPVIEGYDIPDRAIMSKNDYVTFETPSVQTNLPIDNYVLHFPKFLDVLAERARDEGVTLRTNVKVEDPIVENGMVRGFTTRKDREVRADVTVDATGPKAQLTHQLGLMDLNDSPHMVGLEYEAQGTYETKEKMLFQFNPRFAPGGYAWTFPAGDDVFKIGVCWVKKQANKFAHDPDLKDRLENWVENDDRWRMDEVRDLHSGNAYTRPRTEKRSHDGLVAVGDAVASISPMLGEGIRPGMETSDLAAPVVHQALQANDPSREVLGEYDRKWKKSRGHSWRLQQFITRVLYQYNPEQQNEFVRKTKNLDSELYDRYEHYELGLFDLLPLYPFRMKDLPAIFEEGRHQASRWARNIFQ